MRYYLLVFLFSFSTHAFEVGKVIDTNIKAIYKLKDFKKQKSRIDELHSEITKVKKNSKLSDKDFYIATDFLKTLDAISLMSSASTENCFDTRVSLLSEFGVRSVDMSEKNLPEGAKKGVVLLKLICKK